MKTRVRLFYRYTNPIFFSIEKVFNNIAGILKTDYADEFQLEEIQMPFPNSPRNLLKNIRFARRSQTTVNHITGDIHYALLGWRKDHIKILTVHDCVAVHQYRKTNPKHWLIKWLWFSWPARKADVVTAISENTKQELLKITGIPADKVRVITNFVDPAFRPSQYSFKNARPRILFVGTTPNKNLERMAKALKDIPAVLDIVGKLSESQLAALQTEKIDYEQSHGLSAEELRQKYADCDLVAFPTMYEGFGLPIVEAQATERPVLTSALSPMKDVAGDGACLIDPYDTDSIRQGLLQIIGDPVYRETLVEKGRQNVTRFSLQKIAAQYAALYREFAGKRALSVALLFLLTCFGVKGQEEFNGPLGSWADVKQVFGAKGNGKDDDTRAFQLALDNLSNLPKGFNAGPGRFTVIYVPAGTYCISSTLLLKGKIGIAIVGEDPSRTVLKWTGGDNDTILWANASAYFRISRLGWDANGRRKMQAIGIHWKDRWQDANSQSYAACNIELSDNWFLGAFEHGIAGGTYGGEGTGGNDSEVTIRRCRFYSCTDGGIDIHGYNALDYWIWDCLFDHCFVGIRCAHGNFHAFRCYFSASGAFDIGNDNCYYISVRGCYSQNSYGFSFDGGVSCNPFKRIFVDNTVVGLKRYPVEYYHTGKMTFWDNRIDKVRDTANYVANIGSFDWCYATYGTLSINNTYAVASPFNSRHPLVNYQVNDRQTPRVTGDSAAFLAKMDKTPQRVNRKVFELREGATAADIQKFIDQAATLKGSRPILHFGPGTYYLDKTLVIPAGADLQLVGDGMLYATMLMRKDQHVLADAPLIRIEGPSMATLRELQLGSEADHGQRSALVFENVDQPTSEAHLDQVYAPQSDTSLSVTALDYLYIQKDNSFFMTGNVVTGGPATIQGKGTAMVNSFGGQFARLAVRQNGKFIARDCWWEGNDKLALNLTGDGTVSIDGAMIAPSKADSTPTIAIGKFTGNISLMNLYLQGALAVAPDNPKLDLLVWNILFYHKMNPLDFMTAQATYKGAFLGLNAQCFNSNDPGCKLITSIKDRTANIQQLNSFLDNQTQQDRFDKPRIFRHLPGAVSNIYVSRVSIGAVGEALVFRQ